MDFTIPKEWEELTASVRDFAEGEVEPIWRKIEDEDEIPAEVLKKAGALGLFGLTIPEEYGGLGLPMLAKALVYETLGHTHAGFVSIIGTHCGIGTTAIVSLGSEEQKKAYLPKLDGILGPAFFEGHLLTIDYVNSRLKIEDGELPPADGRDILNVTLDDGI